MRCELSSNKSIWIRHSTTFFSAVIAVIFGLSCGNSPSGPPPPKLFIGPPSLGNLSVDQPGQLAVGASGGVKPYSFSVGAGTLPHNMSLASDGQVALISGTPDTVESVSFTIQVTDSANQSASQGYTVAVLLNGDLVSFTPGGLDFGTQLIGTASSKQLMTMTNISISPVSVSGVATGGNNSAEFAESGACSGTLAPNGTCTVGAVFTPAQIGPRSAVLVFTDSTPGSPQGLNLTGVGVVAGPNATPTASSMAFGTLPIGDSVSLSLGLNNYGAATLNISSIATNSPDFTESDNCGTSLASGGGCNITITFTPSTTGSINGTLTFTDDAPDSPQSTALSGTGFAGKCQLKGQVCSITLRCCPGLTCTASGMGAVCQ